MGRIHDPARVMRERLKVLERREKARGEAEAVRAGVAETLGLEMARGAMFEPVSAAGARAGGYRRQAGLEWLVAKGRISERQRVAGERYGEAFRRAEAAPTLGSTLEVQPGGDGGGPSLALLLRLAEGRREAQARLKAYRRRLFGQGDLVAACDLICAKELTPREAGGGEREALRLEAVVKVALDILAMEADERRRGGGASDA